MKIFVTHFYTYFSGTIQIADDVDDRDAPEVIRQELLRTLHATPGAELTGAFAPEYIDIAWDSRHRRGEILLLVQSGHGAGEFHPSWNIFGVPIDARARYEAYKITDAHGHGATGSHINCWSVESAVANAAHDACCDWFAANNIPIEYPGHGVTSWMRPWRKAAQILQDGWTPGDPITGEATP